ncbi:MAG: CRISPR-associated endonuclease Cas1 [Saprospiraceae bacterium]
MEIHIETFGAHLRVRGGIFVFTAPDLSGGEEKKSEYAPHLVKRILFHKNSGSISAAAIFLAMENDIDLIACDEFGMPFGRFYPIGPNRVLGIQAAQFQLIRTPESLKFVKLWIGGKIRRKLAFLERLERYREGQHANLLQQARQMISESYLLLQNAPLMPFQEAAESIRGHEGTASRIYFTTLSNLMEPEYRFEGRSRRPAQDVFNLFLNYGYGILYRITEKALIEAGIHPYAGFLHGLAKKQKSMVFDFIEAFRPWVDSMVFQLCRARAIKEEHIQQEAGGLRLTKQGKELIIKTFQQGFRKKRNDYSGQSLLPLNIIRTEARLFADELMGMWSSRLAF